jgi:hypothetical protein
MIAAIARLGVEISVFPMSVMTAIPAIPAI